jgi:hypothetical protein
MHCNGNSPTDTSSRSGETVGYNTITRGLYSGVGVGVSMWLGWIGMAVFLHYYTIAKIMPVVAAVACFLSAQNMGP